MHLVQEHHTELCRLPHMQVLLDCLQSTMDTFERSASGQFPAWKAPW